MNSTFVGYEGGNLPRGLSDSLSQGSKDDAECKEGDFMEAECKESEAEYKEDECLAEEIVIEDYECLKENIIMDVLEMNRALIEMNNRILASLGI